MKSNYSCYILFGAIILILASCTRTISRFSIGQDESYEAPAVVQFTNQSEEAESYLWDFGDSTTSVETNPAHKYLHSGNYLVTLTAIRGKKKKVYEQRVMVTPPEECLVLMETPKGDMLIRLLDETPQHRDNFLKLAEEKYFDGLLFHRVINQFMIQGGDPNSREATEEQALGSGGPGYQVPAEFHQTHFHYKGALAAARTGDAVNPEKKSSGSQFYIVQGRPVTDQMLSVLEAQKGIEYTPEQEEYYKTHGGTPFLDNEYTVFGQVIEGIHVIDSIAALSTNTMDRPLEDITMKIIPIK